MSFDGGESGGQSYTELGDKQVYYQVRAILTSQLDTLPDVQKVGRTSNGVDEEGENII